MDASDFVERRQRLADICASQRGQLTHDWIMLKQALSPGENIKRLTRPLGAGVLAVIGIAGAVFFFRKRMRMLLWLPRLWTMRKIPGVSGLVRRVLQARHHYQRQ